VPPAYVAAVLLLSSHGDTDETSIPPTVEQILAARRSASPTGRARMPPSPDREIVCGEEGRRPSAREPVTV